MRILCLCQGGNVRSGHLATLLKDRGHDALQAGIEWNTPETVYGLAKNWAEKVTVAEEWMKDLLPEDVRGKVDLDSVSGQIGGAWHYILNSGRITSNESSV